jgi:hypothetical protein
MSAAEGLCAARASSLWVRATAAVLRQAANWGKSIQALWVRRLNARRKPCTRLLSILTRLEIGARKSLLVVACGERRFLVANNAEAITALLEIGPRSQARGGLRAASQELRSGLGRRRVRRQRPARSIAPIAPIGSIGSVRRGDGAGSVR